MTRSLNSLLWLGVICSNALTAFSFCLINCSKLLEILIAVCLLFMNSRDSCLAVLTVKDNGLSR